MKLLSIILIGGLGLLSILDESSGTLMLSSILMALKSGYWAGKLGMGGLFAMMAAKNYEQQRAGSSPGLKSIFNHQIFSPQAQASNHHPITRKRIRYVRSVPINNVIQSPRILNSTVPSTINLSPPTLIQNVTQVNSSDIISREKSMNRVVRQLGILERLSCLPKLLCGLETKEPSTKTTALNDYGALVKLLFGREDDDEVDDEEEEQNDDDSSRKNLDKNKSATEVEVEPETENDSNESADEIESLRHTMGGVTQNSKKNKYRINKNKKKKQNSKKKPQKEEDSDESGDEKEDEKSSEDYKEFDEMSQGVLNWKEMAQDELLSDEPELLAYALMELREELKQKKEQMEKEKGQSPTSKIKNQARDGNRGSNSTRNKNRKRPSNIKYQVDSPSSVQSPYDPYPIQYPESYVPPEGLNPNRNIIDKLNKNIREKFGFGFHSDRPQPAGGAGAGGTVLETLLPSSIYQKFKTYMEDDYPNPGINGGSKNANYHPGEPYFRFPREQVKGLEMESGRTFDEKRQRVNSKFRRLDSEEANFIARKSKELETSTDPLTKYRVALETGQKTKSARQCRLLFSRCPYRYSEIKQIIDNAKEFLDSTATTGDKVVPLKKKKKVPPTGNKKPEIVTGALTQDGVVNLLSPLAKGASANKSGTGMGLSTFVMQQLPNGDFEIKLKVKPKDETMEIQMAPPAAAPVKSVAVQNVKIEPKDDPKLTSVNGTVDDLWDTVIDNSTGKPVADKTFAPSIKTHNLMGIEYPPETVLTLASIPSFRTEVIELDGGSEKKMRPPSHLPPLPSPYKIIRKRVGRPRSVDDQIMIE